MDLLLQVHSLVCILDHLAMGVQLHDDGGGADVLAFLDLAKRVFGFVVQLLVQSVSPKAFASVVEPQTATTRIIVYCTCTQTPFLRLYPICEIL